MQNSFHWFSLLIISEILILSEYFPRQKKFSKHQSHQNGNANNGFIKFVNKLIDVSLFS